MKGGQLTLIWNMDDTVYGIEALLRRGRVDEFNLRKSGVCKSGDHFRLLNESLLPCGRKPGGGTCCYSKCS